MKKLKSCFGKSSMFFKKKIKECKRCQFKTKCLMEINGGKQMKKRARCIVWSRVCGYLRGTDMFNEGKIEEFKDRKIFKTI